MNESEKMLDIIHENCKKEQNKREIKEAKKEKKEKRNRRIELICLAVAFVVILILGCMYKERQVKNCMEQGGSENFCRYAGE